VSRQDLQIALLITPTVPGDDDCNHYKSCREISPAVTESLKTAQSSGHKKDESNSAHLKGMDELFVKEWLDRMYNE